MLYYIYSGKGLIGFVYNSNTYYYHKNIFGDIIGILDANYNEIVSYKYDSYGKILDITDNSGLNIGTINPFRYRSYYYDEETGLYYLNSRYYNPQVGRFINADSIITGQGFDGNNLYVYCNNNPIICSDYNGRLSFLAAALIVIGTKVAINAIAGATVATISQISVNVIDNQSWENCTDGVLSAAVGGAVAGGLSTFIGINILTVSFIGALTTETIKLAQGGKQSFPEYLYNIGVNTITSAYFSGDGTTTGNIVESVAGNLIANKLITPPSKKPVYTSTSGSSGGGHSSGGGRHDGKTTSKVVISSPLLPKSPKEIAEREKARQEWITINEQIRKSLTSPKICYF